MIIGVMDIVQWIVYFTSLYFVVFWLLVLLEFDVGQKPRKLSRNFPTVTLVIPAHNEEHAIGKTIESALAIDYPKDRLEIIVINDGSTDMTDQIARSYLQTGRIKYIKQKNAGKGAALNRCIRLAKGEFFVCLDADSEVEPGSLRLMLPDFQDKKVATVMALMKVKNPESRIQKYQFYEYTVNIFYKRLMQFLDAIHVAPGPFSIYRTRVLRELNGFDEDNLTEDLELAVRLQRHDYKLIQNMNGVVYTIAPKSMKGFLRQRKRWFKGGLFNAIKYRDMLFNRRYGDFGLIQFPVLVISGIIAIMLLLTTVYQLLKPYVTEFLNLIHVNFDIWTFLKTFRWTTDVWDFSYANIVMLLLMFLFTTVSIYYSHKYTREKVAKHGKVSFFLFIFFYFFLLAFTWLLVIKDFVIGVKQKW